MAKLTETGIVSLPEPDFTVIKGPVGVRERLSKLRLSPELLVNAIQRGVGEKMTTEVYDPPTAGGYALYWYTTRHVRKGLHLEGWEISDSNNIALVRDPIDGTIIIVCSGDQQTGQVIGNQPKTKRSKGDLFLAVSEITSTNLFGDEEVETRQVALPDAKVWLLLHYHVEDRGQQILRAELSRPYEAEGGMITKWRERIILHVPLPDALPDDEIADDKGPVITPAVEIRF